MAIAHPTAQRPAYGTRPRAAAAPETRTEKGMSLARGPALVLGTILTAAGLYLLYRAHSFPRFANFPNGTAHADGKFLFGLFAANGWTGMLTAVAGGLLLFGAAQHLLAKTTSLIVGVALGAAAVIALISGDVLGMAAAGHLTELAWGICAVILLFNTIVPRRRREVVVADPAVTAEPAGRVRGTGTGDDAGDAAVADAERHRPVPGDGMAETRAVDSRGAVGAEGGRTETVPAADGQTVRAEPMRAADGEPAPAERR